MRPRTLIDDALCDASPVNKARHSAMWTTIKRLDPRTVLAALRRSAVLPVPRVRQGAPVARGQAGPRPDQTGIILTYDNFR